MAYTIYNKDCIEWMSAQQDQSIDCVLTSPPYDNLRAYQGYCFDFETTAQHLYRCLKPGGTVIWNVADAVVNGSETGSSMRQALYFMSLGFRLHDTMIYVKRNPMPTSKNQKRYHQAWEYVFVFSKGTPKTFNPIMVQTKYSGQANMKYRGRDGKLDYKKTPRNTTTPRRNVFEYTIGGGHTTTNPAVSGHPALMPEQLALDMLKTWSEPGDTVYDPFAGGGTTLWAATQLGIDVIGTEINSDYCSIIHQRLV